LLASSLIAYVGLWAQYRFRFDAGPAEMQLDIPAMTNDLRDAQTRARFHSNAPTQAQLSLWHASAATEIVLWMEEHRLAPQAWAGGYLYTETSSLQRTAYLLGDVYAGSRWFYFPLAWVVKEPVTLLVAVMGAAVVGWRRGVGKLRREGGNYECPLYGWVALGVPPLAYLLMAIFGNVNIGLRHVFPVMPFVDVAVGLAAGQIWMMRRGKVLVLVFGIALVVETLAAYPDFISYFNVAAGGERGGLALLGDSNLDWGQDLPLLAQWQKANPNVTLYLDYFGTADPAAYGIRYLNVPGGYVYGPAPRIAGAEVGGVAAISATKLQGLFAGDPSHDFASRFARQRPFAVLGGTIYLFEFQP
jgi:hypothetical protein